MKKELVEELVNKYPDMFTLPGRGPNPKSSLISNIGCGDGWFDLLMDLCEEIHAMRPQVQQIKEKFGTLRFYASFPSEYSDQGWAVIRKAEERSLETCEDCGEPGEFRIRNGWRYVSCQSCHEQFCEENPEEPYP